MIDQALRELLGQEVELTLDRVQRTPAGGMRKVKLRGEVHSVATSTVYLLDHRYGGMANALGGGMKCALIGEVDGVRLVADQLAFAV